MPAGLQNFDFFYTYFCPHLPHINIPISKRRKQNKITQNFAQIRCFIHLLVFFFFFENCRTLLKIRCFKKTPFLNLCAFVCNETHRSLYQNSRKSTPKGRHTPRYAMMWDPLLNSIIIIIVNVRNNVYSQIPLASQLTRSCNVPVFYFRILYLLFNMFDMCRYIVCQSHDYFSFDYYRCILCNCTLFNIFKLSHNV